LQQQLIRIYGSQSFSFLSSCSLGITTSCLVESRFLSYIHCYVEHTVTCIALASIVLPLFLRHFLFPLFGSP
jgi:hypothetical protein